MAFPAGSSKSKLTIDNTKVSGSVNLTNFPVLVSDSIITSAVYSAMQGDGDDIRFTTDSGGNTEVPFEIVALNSGLETCEIWVKLPVVSYNSDTVFYIWYGDATLTAYSASDTYGSQNVWTDYGAVYHFEGNSNDSTANGNNGTDTNMTWNSSAKIGQDGIFQGSDEYISVSDDASVTNLFDSGGTFQSWADVDSLGENSAGRLIDKSNINVLGWYVRVVTESGSTCKLVFNSQWSTTDGNWTTSNFDITYGQYHMVHITYDADSTANAPSVFIDGSSKSTTTSTPAGTRVSDSTYGFGIGNRLGTTNTNFDGNLDEMRLRTTTISSDWVATEYNNQNSPSTFITLSDATDINKVSGVSYANIKKISGVAIADVKKISGLA